MVDKNSTRSDRAQQAELEFIIELHSTAKRNILNNGVSLDDIALKAAIQGEKDRLLETPEWKAKNAEIQGEYTAIKARKAGVSSEVELLSERKLFQEQCFLVNNALQIAKAHNFRMRDEQIEAERQNHPVLRSEHTALMAENPYEIIGTWDSVENVDLLSKLTPAQKAVLVPKIKVYKVFFAQGSSATGGGTNLQTARGRAVREIPVVFDDHTRDSDISRITSEAKGRMSGIGITYFRLKEKAINDAEIDKNMKCRIGIRAQSMDEFLPSTKEAQNDLGSRAKFADFWYKNPESQIKVALGWQIPSTIPTDLISTKLRNAILSCTRVIYLNLETYDLTFNEDGTVLFEGDYRANAESFLDDPGFNVFYLDPFVYSDGSCKDSHDVARQIKQYETRMEVLRQTISLRAAAQKSLGTSNSVLGIASSYLGGDDPTELISDDQTKAKLKSAGFSDAAIQAMTYRDLENLTNSENLEDIEKELAELVGEKTLFSNQYKYYRWSHLLTYLRKESKVYTVTADINTGPNAGKTEPYYRLYSAGPTDTHSSKALDDFGASIQKHITEPDSAKFNAAMQSVVVNNSTYKMSTGPEPYKTVAFLYFGDLVDAAIKTVKQNPSYNKNRTEVDIVLGPAIVYDDSGQRTMINLSDIPISLTLFQSFMLKRYISLDRGTDENVTLHRFISDCMQYLLRDSIEGCSESVQVAMNRKQYLAYGNNMVRGYETGRKILITKGTFHLPYGYVDFDSPLPDFGGASVKDELNTAFAGNKTPLENIPISQVRHHMLYHMVDAMFAGSSKEQVKQDKAIGVYRFLLGSDKGLMKKITFTPTDIQYQAESNQLEENISINKRYKRLYRANISSIGNTIFKPSSKIFIDPSFIGSSRNSSGDFGLDGYYFVEEIDHVYGRDTYETNIHCNWSAPSRPPPRSDAQPTPSKPKYPSFYRFNGLSVEVEGKQTQ